MIRRAAAILLALCFAALGSGALERVHNLAHVYADAAVAAAAAAADPHDEHAPSPHHDDTNCETHAQLHMPFTAAGWVPLLVCLGLLVAFLTQIARPMISSEPLLRLDCRGPPIAC